jgi:hypothetical protein
LPAISGKVKLSQEAKMAKKSGNDTDYNIGWENGWHSRVDFERGIFKHIIKDEWSVETAAKKMGIDLNDLDHHDYQRPQNPHPELTQKQKDNLAKGRSQRREASKN